MTTRLIQFMNSAGETRVACVLDTNTVQALDSRSSMSDLALEAIEQEITFSALVAELATGAYLDYAELITSGRVLPPILHPDTAHMLISGTGLTHLGSADTRNAMHAKLKAEDSDLTDSMKMFRMGLEKGKPAAGETGVQPEWFYKGDGSILVAPEKTLPSPAFALDGGEEPEICGIYLVGPDSTPFRIGFALGNEFSDHRMERINYLYLAHSKLRPCAIGPELRIGPLPAHIEGQSRIRRANKIIWEKPFLSGEDNMSHSIANLEAHHFKYRQFLRPGDIHVHFFGTGTLSFADGIETAEGDVFEINAPEFGRPLRNTLGRLEQDPNAVTPLD